LAGPERLGPGIPHKLPFQVGGDQEKPGARLQDEKRGRNSAQGDHGAFYAYLAELAVSRVYFKQSRRRYVVGGSLSVKDKIHMAEKISRIQGHFIMTFDI
jgi:hypothetical protein